MLPTHHSNMTCITLSEGKVYYQKKNQLFTCQFLLKKRRKQQCHKNFHSVSVRISPTGPVYLGAVLCARPRCLSIWGILNVGALLALVEHLSVKW